MDRPERPALCEKYGVPLNDDGLASHYRYRDSHRLRLLSFLRAVVLDTLGYRACALLDRITNRLVYDRLLEMVVPAKRYLVKTLAHCPKR